MKPSSSLSAIAVAFATVFTTVATAATPDSVIWNSVDVPEFTNGQFEFSGTDVSSLSDNYWASLESQSGASGILNNLVLDIKALNPVNGTDQDKQIWGTEITGGEIEFGGEKLNIAIETDFVGGGNNSATAFDFYSPDTTTISASDVVLNVISKASNGKSVYGIGVGEGGTLNINGTSLAITLETATYRDNPGLANNYSQAVGMDVYNGVLNISDNTNVTINVKSTSEVQTTNGNDGASPAYGILYEGGQGNIAGNVEIVATANGGNAVGVGVTNYFYNTSMGQNWNSTAANINKIKVTAESNSGSASAIEATYTTGEETNEVILKVTGDANLTATTQTGEATGIRVSGPTEVQIDGNLISSAVATDETGKAYSVKTSAGTLSINGAENSLSGNVDVSDTGALVFGENSTTLVNGDISSAEGTQLVLNSAELELASGHTADIQGALNSTNGTITINEVSDSPILTVAELSGNLTVAASSQLNDSFASAQEAAAAMKQSVAVTTAEDGSVALTGKSGTIADNWTADLDGNITSHSQNESLNAFENFNAMTLVAWRSENNHLTQRLGDIRDNAGTVGTWARIYGYDSKFSDAVSIKYKSNAIQAGADFRFAENYVAGAALSYTNGDGDFSNGSADAESYTLAAYLSGFFPCGGYFDVIGRVGRLSTDITAANQTNIMKASYDNTVLGLSAEVGYRYEINTMFYAEPQLELSYAVALGDDFTASNGLKVSQDDYQSLVGRLGARIGANFADNKGSVYLTASVNHDFLGDADSTAKLGQVVKSQSVDAGGTWVSYGVGAQFKTTENLNFYGSLEKSSGSEYREDYRYNVGLRYVW